MPAYSFQLSSHLAGRAVSVVAAGSSTVVASGTLDGSAKFVADLPVGDYVAAAGDGKYAYQAAGTVDQGDSDRLVDLNSTYAPVYRPSDITALTTINGPYDPLRNLYNLKPSSLRKTRQRIGQARAGTGLCRIVCAGDSITAGQGGATKPDTGSYPAYLRAALTTKGIPSAGTGVVNTMNNAPGTSNTDGRWTLSGAWTSGSAQGLYVKATTAGATATFASDKAGTILELIYLDSSAGFTYTLDGAAAVTVTPTGALQMATLTLTGLANTTHTVTVTTSTAAAVYLVGVQVRGTTGLLVSNAGAGGTTTADWVDTNWFKCGPTSRTAAYSPDLVILGLGVNDGLKARTVAAYRTDLTSTVQQYRTAGAEVILLAPSYFTEGTYSTFAAISNDAFAAYRAACYDVANTLDAPLVDLGDRWGRYATEQANGGMQDGVHPNSSAYADLGSLLSSILLPGA